MAERKEVDTRKTGAAFSALMFAVGFMLLATLVDEPSLITSVKLIGGTIVVLCAGLAWR